jgi:phosphatidylserine/phosphatidylglycerophosphate/cardiolipin synthase-like enzyme
VDSLFFAEVARDTVRVFGAVEKGTGHRLHALDLKTSSTLPAMAKAFGVERLRLKTMSVPKPVLTWVDASRVVPIPNDKYVPAVTNLIRSAKQRVWVAMLDARYYETRPVPAERDKRRPKDAPPSLTNVILDDLMAAARRGVDVQVVCDMGRGTNPPNSKLAFMKKLQDAGGKVFWDSPEVTMHAKLLIVDDDFAVVGSTNWTQPAVEDNNETAVLVESPEINQHYAGFIASAKGQACDLRPIGGGAGGLPSP